LDVNVLQEELDDAVLQAVTRRAYFIFRMFNDSMEEIARREGTDGLKARLHLFMHHYIPVRRSVPFFRSLRSSC
jgi:hypothetical protein